MSAEAVVFCRRSGANRLGHVGWGFNLFDGSWAVGSMEDTAGVPFAPTGWTGFWYRHVPNAQVAMQHPTNFGAPNGTPPYDLAKVLDVLVPNPVAAQAKIQEWAMRGYNIAGGNCMNCTFDILRAFGAALPDPSSPNNWEPNAWFDDIQGRALPA